MKLIFIYGPPGVGKLTVAGALAAATGYKLFHNHVSIDCVLPVFDFGTPSFSRLVGKIRLDVIEEAARENIPGLIFTFVYAHPQDAPFVEKICASVERHGGEACLVRLFCDTSALEQRVLSHARRGAGKISSLETLREVAGRHDIFSAFEGRESLSVDNTHAGPAEVARRIAAHYGLPGREPRGPGRD